MCPISVPIKYDSYQRTSMPVKPITTAAQHNLLPIEAPKSDFAINPPQ